MSLWVSPLLFSASYLPRVVKIKSVLLKPCTCCWGKIWCFGHSLCSVWSVWLFWFQTFLFRKGQFFPNLPLWESLMLNVLPCLSLTVHLFVFPLSELVKLPLNLLVIIHICQTFVSLFLSLDRAAIFIQYVVSSFDASSQLRKHMPSLLNKIYPNCEVLDFQHAGELLNIVLRSLTKTF